MNDKKLNITQILNNNDLIGNQLQFACKEYKYGYGDPTQKEHDAFNLTLEEIAAILNFNPLL